MMRAVDIAKLGSDRKRVKEIYMRAFPRDERMPFWMMRAMAKMQNTRFLAFYEEALLCGFVYMAVAGNIVFVMFFAVEESLRLAVDMGAGSWQKSRHTIRDKKLSFPLKNVMETHRIWKSGCGAKDFTSETDFRKRGSVSSWKNRSRKLS